MYMIIMNRAPPNETKKYIMRQSNVMSKLNLTRY